MDLSNKLALCSIISHNLSLLVFRTLLPPSSFSNLEARWFCFERCPKNSQQSYVFCKTIIWTEELRSVETNISSVKQYEDYSDAFFFSFCVFLRYFWSLLWGWYINKGNVDYFWHFWYYFTVSCSGLWRRCIAKTLAVSGPVSPRERSLPLNSKTYSGSSKLPGQRIGLGGRI